MGLVSIVIPLFNSEERIERTLTALLSQTYSNWECLLIDDGSTDNSKHVVEAFIEKNKGTAIRLISIPNSGVSVARNTGISIASGEFIALLDHDDIWLPEKLEMQIAFLKKYIEFDGVLCNFRIAKMLPDRSIKTVRIVRNNKLGRLTKNWLLLEGNGAFPTSTFLFRARGRASGTIFDPDFSYVSDLDFIINFQKLARIGNVDFALVEYLQHASQMHLNPSPLKAEYPLLLEKLGETFSQQVKNRAQGNVYVLSALLNLRSRHFLQAIRDARFATRYRPLSLISLPLYVVRKRITTYWNRFFLD